MASAPPRGRPPNLLYLLADLPFKKTRRHTYPGELILPTGETATVCRRSRRNDTVVSSFAMAAIATVEPFRNEVFFIIVSPYRFSMTRSFALRLRGLRAISASDGAIADFASPFPM